MKTQRWFLRGGCLLILSPVYGLTLREAVQQARERNPDLQSAQEQFARKEAENQHAIRSLFPNFQLYSSTRTRQDSIHTPTYWLGGEVYNVYNLGVKGEFTVFAGGASWGELQRSRKESAIAHLESEIVARDLTVHVIESFYKVLLSTRKKETYEKTIGLLRQLVQVSQKRRHMGTEREAAVLQAQAELARTEPKVQEAENDRLLSGTELARWLGLREIPSLKLQAYLSESALIHVAEKFRKQETLVAGERPEILKSELKVEQVRDLQRIQMASHWPQLKLQSDMAYVANKTSDLFHEPARTWFVGIEFSIPFFSGFNSLTQRRILAHEGAQRRLEQVASSNQQALERTQETENLILLRSRLESLKSALKLAQQSFQVAQRDYSRGVGTYTQVFESQKTHMETELEHDKTLYDFLLALVRYHVAYALDLDPLIQALSDMKGKAS